ncbi:uncharacterized protein V6R79_005673 [Siganus canaliculatus]
MAALACLFACERTCTSDCECAVTDLVYLVLFCGDSFKGFPRFLDNDFPPLLCVTRQWQMNSLNSNQHFETFKHLAPTTATTQNNELLVAATDDSPQAVFVQVIDLPSGEMTVRIIMTRVDLLDQNQHRDVTVAFG